MTTPPDLAKMEGDRVIEQSELLADSLTKAKFIE